MKTEIYSSNGGNKWLSLIVGIISICIGIWCICTPQSSLLALTYVFIIGLFAEGFIDITLAFSSTYYRGWVWRLVAGIVEILLGIWIWVMPIEEATLIMIYVVGFWVFFTSVMGIAESVQLSRVPGSFWGWMLFLNIIGVICAFLFLIGPSFGGLFTVVFAGCSFITYGIFRCLLRF